MVHIKNVGVSSPSLRPPPKFLNIEVLKRGTRTESVRVHPLNK